MRNLASLMVATLLLAACAGPTESSVARAPGRREARRLQPAPSEAGIKVLTRDFEFSIGRGRWAIYAGDYSPYGADATGIYYKSDGKGIVLPGNLGMHTQGGIYLPFDESRPLGIWMMPNVDAAIGILGPAGATTARQYIAHYLTPIPDKDSSEIRSALSSRQ